MKFSSYDSDWLNSIVFLIRSLLKILTLIFEINSFFTIVNQWVFLVSKLTLKKYNISKSVEFQRAMKQTKTKYASCLHGNYMFMPLCPYNCKQIICWNNERVKKASREENTYVNNLSNFGENTLSLLHCINFSRLYYLKKKL